MKSSRDGDRASIASAKQRTIKYSEHEYLQVFLCRTRLAYNYKLRDVGTSQTTTKVDVS